jgi:serine/threonine-protein kinase
MSATDSNRQASGSELADTVVPSGQPLKRTQIMSQDASPGTPKAPKPASGAEEAAKKTTRLGDFELRKELGQGGMGKVYLAQQLSLDRPCALKMMSNELARKPGFVERFVREARSMAKIDHPNVVKCYAVGEAQGRHYVAMELIDGRSMQDWLDDLGKLTVPDAVLVALICADALAHAHGLNMIHRDIKPDNILVTRQGHVKVADLGLAKAMDDDMSMTASGTGLGTPHYMPPEQARNAKHVDGRSDIYALGCTLYHFLTGKVPFAGETIVDLITNKEKGQFTPARRLNAEVPERLDLIIDKMMAKDPKYRYASCQEVIRDLESLNLAAESLSFIDSPQRAVIRRSGGPSTQSMGGRVTQVPASSSSSRAGRRDTDAGSRESSGGSSTRQMSSESSRTLQTPADNVWYVRYTDSSGKIKVSKMAAPQILQAMKQDKLDLSTRVSRERMGEFLPFSQVPVFEEEARRMATRQQARKREQNLASAYAKIERQYDRQKWWRLLSRFRDGTLGLVGLLIWLIIVVVAVIAAGLGVMYGYQYLGAWLESKH